MLTKQQEIGQARAALARANYLAQPNICRNCQQAILPKEGEKIKRVRCRRFCSKSCAAQYNNVRVPKRKRKERSCQHCGTSTIELLAARRLCEECWVHKQVRVAARCKGDTSRKNLYIHAASIMRTREKRCVRCGYALFVDVCHIQAVKDFPETALLSEINDPGNLAYLCPNCHHELDAGLLVL